MKLFTLFLLFVELEAQAVNLIHNGSFEIGSSGWNRWGNLGITSEGGDMATASAVVSSNNAYVHGGRSFLFLGRAVSPPFWCFAGQTNTLTFSARTDSTKTLNAAIMPTYTVTLDPTNSAAGPVTDYQVTVTSTWQRFTNQYVVKTNGFHIVKLYQTGANMWVDAVQVETGSVAHVFAPASPVEVGMDTADSENVLFLGDIKRLRFNFWNDPVISTLTNVVCHYSLQNMWNTNLASGSVSTNSMVTGRTTINLSLPALNGSIRSTCYITNINHTWDETIVTQLPFAAQSGKDYSGILGLDGNWGAYPLSSYRRLGFSQLRILSNTREARWIYAFPTLTTTQMFSGAWYMDYVISNIMASDMIPFITLTPEDASWRPQSETNATWSVMRGDFTNYAGRFAYRYRSSSGGPLVVTNYEFINETQQNPRDAVALYDPVYYSDLYTNSVSMMKAIDAKINVFCCGGQSTAAQGTNFWAYISPTEKAHTARFTFHFYPQNDGTKDPNGNDDLAQYTTANYFDWRREFISISNSWNTENATRDTGAFHTELVAFSYPFWYDDMKNESGTTASYWSGNQAWFQELDCRGHVPAVDRETYNFCRSIGAGMTHFNLQYGATLNDNMFTGNTPSIYELNSTLKPWAAALLVANNFIKTPGLGRITNVNEYYVEAWGHTNTLGNVASIWCPDKGGRTLTFTNTPSIAQFDTMGNLIKTNPTTINIGRSITYLVSGTIPYGLFRTNIERATVATNVDVTAPGLTVDVSPIGTAMDSGGFSNVFKATAIDETVSTYGVSNATVGNVSVTNVYYRWTFNDGVTFSPWSVTNVFLYSFASAGMHRIGWQAKDAAANASEVVYGPYFGALVSLTTNSLTTINANTVNAGTLNFVH